MRRRTSPRSRAGGVPACAKNGRPLRPRIAGRAATRRLPQSLPDTTWRIELMAARTREDELRELPQWRANNWQTRRGQACLAHALAKGRSGSHRRIGNRWRNRGSYSRVGRI
jgi:hypothetical protein